MVEGGDVDVDLRLSLVALRLDFSTRRARSIILVSWYSAR